MPLLIHHSNNTRASSMTTRVSSIAMVLLLICLCHFTTNGSMMTVVDAAVERRQVTAFQPKPKLHPYPRDTRTHHHRLWKLRGGSATPPSTPTTPTTTAATPTTVTPPTTPTTTSPPPATTTTTTTTNTKMANPKLANLKERALSAVLMLGGLILWLDTFREKGLVALVLVVQLGLFREGTNVVLPHTVVVGGGPGVSKPMSKRMKWWWFLAYNLALVGPRLLTTRRDGSPLFSSASIYLTSFGMVAFGLMHFVIDLNRRIAFSYEFQTALEELATWHLATVFTTLPAAFWIATIQDFGMPWVLYGLYLVIINDTMAYVFGASFGKRPLLPTISPKKTWEGFLGALMSTLAASVLLYDKMGLGSSASAVATSFPQQHALCIAAYCSLVAPFGGFVASIVKRAYGKKDFSNMIAGHGGFIDRLDCQLITAPFLYLYLRRFVMPWKK